MLLSIGRAATRQVASTAIATPFSRPLVLRGITKSPYEALGLYRHNRCAARAYATATRKKTAAAPKKSTRRAPAKKPAKKTKKATTTKAKAKAKPKPKAKSKAKAKPKATTRGKGKPRGRPMSEERKTTLERQALKRAALFSDPKLLAAKPWPLYVAEQTRGKVAGTPVTDQITTLSQQYKELSPDELQRLQSVAEQNKAKNAVIYKAWVESHTPQEIYDANLARRTLKRKFNYPKGSMRPIVDTRVPKAPPTSYALFTKARWAFGDFLGVSLLEAAARVGKEWKALSEAERQRYTDQSQSGRASYEKARDTIITTKTTSRRSSPK